MGTRIFVMLRGPSYQHMKHTHPEATQTSPRHTRSHPFPIYPQYWKKKTNPEHSDLFYPTSLILMFKYMWYMFFQSCKHKIIFLEENKHSLVQCTQGNVVWTPLHPWNKKSVKANSKIGLQKEVPQTINNCPVGFTEQAKNVNLKSLPMMISFPGGVGLGPSLVPLKIMLCSLRWLWHKQPCLYLDSFLVMVSSKKAAV